MVSLKSLLRSSRALAMLAVVATWPYLYSMMTGMRVWNNKPALKGKLSLLSTLSRPALVIRALMLNRVDVSASLLDAITLDT